MLKQVPECLSKAMFLPILIPTDFHISEAGLYGICSKQTKDWCSTRLAEYYLTLQF